MTLPLLGAGRGSRPVGGGGGGFDPLTIFDAYWDATDEATITGSPGVTGLADKVGSWDLQSDGINAPTTGDAGVDLNGLNVLSFDGTEKLWHPAANGIALSDNFDFFALMYFDATLWEQNVTGETLFALGDYSDGAPRMEIINNTVVSTFRLNVSSVGAGNVSAAAVPSTGWHLFRMQGIDNTSLRVWVDGTLVITASGTYTGPAGATMSLVIAGNATGGNEYATRFAEAGIIDGGAMSGGDLTAFHSFLNTKYGLSIP